MDIYGKIKLEKNEESKEIGNNEDSNNTCTRNQGENTSEQIVDDTPDLSCDILYHRRCQIYEDGKKCHNGDYCGKINRYPKEDKIPCRNIKRVYGCKRTADDCWFWHMGYTAQDELNFAKEQSVGTLIKRLRYRDSESKHNIDINKINQPGCSQERKKTNNKRKKVADIPDIIYLTEVKKVIKRRKVATSTQTDENDFLEPVKLIRYEKRYKRFGNKIKNRKKCLEVIELSSDED